MSRGYRSWSGGGEEGGAGASTDLVSVLVCACMCARMLVRAGVHVRVYVRASARARVCMRTCLRALCVRVRAVRARALAQVLHQDRPRLAALPARTAARRRAPPPGRAPRPVCGPSRPGPPAGAPVRPRPAATGPGPQRRALAAHLARRCRRRESHPDVSRPRVSARSESGDQVARGAREAACLPEPTRRPLRRPFSPAWRSGRTGPGLGRAADPGPRSGPRAPTRAR
jgi:hypothetical protein